MYLAFWMKMESLSSSMISIWIYHSSLYLDLKKSFVYLSAMLMNGLMLRYISNLIKNNKDVYYVFISNYNIYTFCQKEDKWKTLFNCDDSFCWKAIYNAHFICTKNSKLLWLEYRILHRLVGTRNLNICFFTVIRVNNCGCSWNT